MFSENINLAFLSVAKLDNAWCASKFSTKKNLDKSFFIYQIMSGIELSGREKSGQGFFC